MPLVAHTKLKTSRNVNRLAEQSFGMCNIHKDRILFDIFRVIPVEEERRRRRRKKMSKIEIFKFSFLNLVKGLWNFLSRFSIRIAKGSSL